MKTRHLFLVVCLSAGACSQRQDLASSLDAGDLPSRTCTAASPPDAGAPGSIVAVWDGYIEQSFRDTSDDQVHIVVRSSDSGQLSATAVFGAPASPPQPPATSDDCGPADPAYTAGTPNAPPLRLAEGFEYQLTGVAMSDVRFQFKVPTYQPLADWCACQPSFSDSLTCLPNEDSLDESAADGGPLCTVIFGYDGPSPQKVVTACCRIQRCMDMECQCDQSGCAYNAGFVTQYDLSINGTRADGDAMHLMRTQ